MTMGAPLVLRIGVFISKRVKFDLRPRLFGLMLRSQNVHILVQTNDVYFAVTMLTLYVADIQTNNQTIQPATLSLNGPNTQSPKNTFTSGNQEKKVNIHECWTWLRDELVLHKQLAATSVE